MSKRKSNDSPVEEHRNTDAFLSRRGGEEGREGLSTSSKKKEKEAQSSLGNRIDAEMGGTNL